MLLYSLKPSILKILFLVVQMTTPAIQNDFSYYRRTVMRGKLESNNGTDPGEDDVTIDHQLANKMSLFYANSTPMLKILSEATSKFVTEVSSKVMGSVRIRQGRKWGLI